MDTVDYETNALVINNISSIAFRIYSPGLEQSATFPSTALQVESVLRGKGHLTIYDASRRGLWQFQVVGKEDHGIIAGFSLDTSIDVCGHTLTIRKGGTLEPDSLHRTRPQAQLTSNVSNSSSSGAVPTSDLSQRNALVSPSQLAAPATPDQAQSPVVEPESKFTSSDIPNKTVYDFFIAAVLQNVSSGFCELAGALPLNYRTVLLRPNALRRDESDKLPAEDDPSLGTFRAYLATTGSLVIGLSVSRCPGLSCLGPAAATGAIGVGQSIVAAPFGVLARHQAHYSGGSGTASLAQTPNPQAVILRYAPDLRESLWRQACSRILEQRGVPLSMLKDCPWINLLVAKKKFQDPRAEGKRSVSSVSTATIPWPGPLCFRKRAVEVPSTCRLGDTMLSGHEESHDSLGSARAWYTAGVDRDERLKKRKAERAASLPKETNNNNSHTGRPNGQSPLAVRRPSTAAVGAMYPTPPDALQNPTGITPSLDGTTSSPGNPSSAAAFVDMESNMPHMGRVTGLMNEGYESSEGKRNQNENIMLDESPDNVFEDMGGDMFGDNDITEDDFSFFDQQPNKNAEDLDMGGHSAPSDNANLVTVSKPDEEQPDVGAVVDPPSQASVDDAVFAKPELRHASSYRNGQANAPIRESQTAVSKRSSSPFDFNTVFKRVRSSSEATESRPNSASTDTSHQIKIFQRVEFDPVLPLINRKYEQGGIFDFNGAMSAEQSKPGLGMLPETEYLKRHGKENRRIKVHQAATPALLNNFAEVEMPTSHPTMSKLDTLMSDIEISSIESEQDDSSYTTEDPSSPIRSNTKAIVVEDDVVSQATSFREPEPVEEPDQHLALELPRLSKPDDPEISLCKLFADPEPLPLDVSLSNDDLIQIAQILTEQASTGSLNIFGTEQNGPTTTIPMRKRHSSQGELANSLRILQAVVSPVFVGAGPSLLKVLLDVQDVPLVGPAARQPGRLQPRPVPGRDPNPESMRPSNLYQIPGPHVEVKRSETKLSVLSSAVNFWESLGLAPSSGPKDINAIAIFPGWIGMAENVNTFLGRLQSVYESRKLGSFEKLPQSGDLDDGIIPYEVNRISTSPDATTTGHGSALIESMGLLRAAVSNLTCKNNNIVIYYIYSPDNPATIVDACTAFQRFFDSYQKTLSAKQEIAQNEVVLQLVSAEAVSSPTSVVILPPAQLAKLCMETYDRCTLFSGSMPAPGIRLEKAMPLSTRGIDFKLSATPSAALMQENSCMHVAYAQSVDDRWVAAAWTDERGNQHATAAYCLGRRGKPSSTSLNDVAHEIWESTLQLISVWKVHWRVIITKAAPMGQQEIDFWLDLARTEAEANVTVVLMTVDTSPSLQLIPPKVKLPQSTTSFYTTPVSTPQANVVSPEQSATPATPMRDAAAAATPGAESPSEPDSEAVLVDMTDQTWAAILGHRLSNSTTVLELQPALASGFLIKRTGPMLEDPPVLMEVNLIHTDAVARTYEPLLREMLSQFRGLGTLARVRGVTDREADVRPWHVAAAEKAVRALYLLM